MQTKMITAVVVIVVILLAIFLFDGYQKSHQGYMEPSDSQQMMQDSTVSSGNKVNDIEADLKADVESSDKDFSELDAQINTL